MQAVRSSNVSAWEYNGGTHQLTVVFRNGATYVYEPVSQYIADMLSKSPSFGDTLNRLVKRTRIPYRRVG